MSTGSTVNTRFKLHINSWDQESEIDSLLKSPIIQENVKELDIRIEPKEYGSKYYHLHSSVLNGRCFTLMKLNDLVLENGSKVSVNLPCLKSLWLENVHLKDVALSNLLLGCPSLKKLRLNNCSNLVNPRIESSSLKSLEIVKIHRILKLKAINLECLLIDGLYDDINVSECTKNIKNLSLYNISSMSEQSLEDLISTLPVLEYLSLSQWPWLTCIKISSKSLKSFAFRKDHGAQVKVTMETPNLDSFCYKGDTNFVMSMTKYLSSRHLLTGNIMFYDPSHYDFNWFLGLMTFLSAINDCLCCNTLSLQVPSEEALIFPVNLRKNCESLLPNLKHLKVKTYSQRLNKKSELRDALNWASPSLETLAIEEETEA